MKRKLVLIGIVISMIPMAASADFFSFLGKLAKGADNIGKTVKQYDDNSRAKGGSGILSEKQRARLDAFTSAGVGGKAIVGASIATNVYGQVAKKDVSSANEIFDNAITNYNSNNRVIEENNWNGNANNSSAINAIYSVGAASYAKQKEKDAEKANEAFMEVNKLYTDPNSSYYDPYFYETLTYDKYGRITGRMNTYDRIQTIKSIQASQAQSSWTNSNNDTPASTSTGSKAAEYSQDKITGINEAELIEIGERRKQNMQNFIEGKYNEPQIEEVVQPQSQPLEDTVKIISPITISGYQLNAVEVDDDMLPQLDEVINVLTANPDVKVLIIGHTCDLGNDKVNLTKGQLRADNAKNYLVNKGGISEERISTESKGENNPIVENSSSENRKVNRRIEVVFNQ